MKRTHLVATKAISVYQIPLFFQYQHLWSWKARSWFVNLIMADTEIMKINNLILSIFSLRPMGYVEEPIKCNLRAHVTNSWALCAESLASKCCSTLLMISQHNTGWGNGLVLTGHKLLPESMLTKNFSHNMASLGHGGFTGWSTPCFVLAVMI